MKLYRLKEIDKLIEHYEQNGGECTEIKEGVLGYGVTVLTAEGLKTAVISERYLNECSSGHSVRLYNKTPKKYEMAV